MSLQGWPRGALRGGLPPVTAALVPDQGPSVCLQVLRCKSAGCPPGVPGELPAEQEWGLGGDTAPALSALCDSRSWPEAWLLGEPQGPS